MNMSQDDKNSQVRSWPLHDSMRVPKSFLCPLTKEIMNHPVIDKEGNSYEKDAIIKYLQMFDSTGRIFPKLRHNAKGPRSPVTNSPMQIDDLVDNKGLKEAIDVALQLAIEMHNMRNTNEETVPPSSLAQNNGNIHSMLSSNTTTMSRDKLKMSVRNVFGKVKRKGGKGDERTGYKLSDDDIEQTKESLERIRKKENVSATSGEDSSSVSEDLVFGQSNTEEEVDKKLESAQKENLDRSDSMATVQINNTTHSKDTYPIIGDLEDFNLSIDSTSLSTNSAKDGSSVSSSKSSTSPLTEGSDQQNPTARRVPKRQMPQRYSSTKSINRSMISLMTMEDEIIPEYEQHKVPPRQVQRWASMTTLDTTSDKSTVDGGFDISTVTEAFLQHDNLMFAEKSLTSLSTEADDSVDEDDPMESLRRKMERFASSPSSGTEETMLTVMKTLESIPKSGSDFNESTASIQAFYETASLDTALESTASKAIHQHDILQFAEQSMTSLSTEHDSFGTLQYPNKPQSGPVGTALRKDPALRRSTGDQTLYSDESFTSNEAGSVSAGDDSSKEIDNRRRRLSQDDKVPSMILEFVPGNEFSVRMRQMSDLTMSKELDFDSSATTNSSFFNSSEDISMKQHHDE